MLTEREKHLVGLAVTITRGCAYCTGGRTEKALASGITQVNRIYHLDRGYERMEEKLAALGARVQRVAGR